MLLHIVQTLTLYRIRTISTYQIFKISKVFRGDPTVYEIEDHEGEPIIEKFYEEELSAVNKKDDTYRIEKVLRKKNGMALVKWLGYDSPSWIPIKDIQYKCRKKTLKNMKRRIDNITVKIMIRR